MMLSICLFAIAAASDATGTWKGTLSGDGRENSAHLILKQEGKLLTGSGGPDEGEQRAIRNGVVGDNDALSFEIEQGNAVMKFTARLDGDSITGEVSREQDGKINKGTLNVKRSQDLVKTITALDAAVFAAYNACDLPKFGSYFASGIEFYHDKGGLMNTVDGIVEATRNNICGKVRRELVSIEVYPIPGYGAMETGLHKFYNRSSGKEETGPPAKFFHIWQQKGEEWKMTRVVSFAH